MYQSLNHLEDIYLRFRLLDDFFWWIPWEIYWVRYIPSTDVYDNFFNKLCWCHRGRILTYISVNSGFVMGFFSYLNYRNRYIVPYWNVSREYILCLICRYSRKKKFPYYGSIFDIFNIFSEQLSEILLGSIFVEINFWYCTRCYIATILHIVMRNGYERDKRSDLGLFNDCINNWWDLFNSIMYDFSGRFSKW